MILRGRDTMYTSMLHVRYRLHRPASLSASDAKQLHSYLELQPFNIFLKTNMYATPGHSPCDAGPG